MKCPCCGGAELIHDTRDMPYIYKGQSTNIPAVTGDFCPACAEVILDREHGDRYSDLLGQFQRQVNTPRTFLSQVRSVSRPPRLPASEQSICNCRAWTFRHPRFSQTPQRLRTHKNARAQSRSIRAGG
jgi:YgiT-type zinc finger domain-containing protein